MKVLVTVGFEKHAFDRLLRTVDDCVERKILPDDLLLQIGNSQHLPKHGAYQRFMYPREMKKAVAEADLIIAHGGVGTVLSCLIQGKVPVIFPRSARFREHVDDHQVHFTKIMEKHHKVIAAYSPEELYNAVQHYAVLKELCSTQPIYMGSPVLQDHLKGLLKEAAASIRKTP